MQKANRNPSGFGAVVLIVVAVILVLLGSVGWMIYQRQTPSSGTTTHTTTPPTATTDLTANWKRVESIGGAYSIKVPDGWELVNYPGNTLNGDSINFSQGKPAVITAESSPYAGDQRKFNVAFTDKQYPAPQWQSPNPYGTATTTGFSIGNLKGTRYSLEYTETVTGITKGDKVYQYVFDLPNGKQLTILYTQNAGDADNLKTVEQAIKTIVVNE